METTTIRIEGMHCEGCAGRVKSLLEKQPGVREADVSYADGEARVRYNGHGVDAGTLRGIIVKAGYTPQDAP